MNAGNSRARKWAFTALLFILTAGLNAQVSVTYSDTLSVPSLFSFDLPVKMKTGHEVSAISLGFLFPEEYMAIDSMELAAGASGFSYSVKDGLFKMAWSSPSPLVLPDNSVLLTLRCRSLDFSLLDSTIRLQAEPGSEFADAQAVIIDNVILELPELGYKSPGWADTIGESYVSIYPNPFSHSTTINFYLEEESRVKISITGTDGRQNLEVAEGLFEKGPHAHTIFASDLANGVFFIKFELSNPSVSGVRIFKVMVAR